LFSEYPNPYGLLSIAAEMLGCNKIRIKFTKQNSGRQKLINIYTTIERRALKTI